ncbi:MAG: 2-keto-4-pentenoate hydratase/2-oxohepta-3-ene,7-dioic acid hydratase, partial [Bradyrhizobium sp.]|nr:2-keto-4-pentenoate hydratase/2-oxohepta-3-ene,7-dioic acid hydratase [Bradyrhizobium sp.]
EQFDWEIELAVVIGRRLTQGDEAAAQRAIAGYSIGIDFSCRDLLHPEGRGGVDLVRAKAQDGMAPLGPGVVPARFVGDVQKLALKLWVNDRLRQDGTTANMLFPVAEQIATISQYITLEPGDVVFTGSPAGSAEGDYLKPGDQIRAEIEHVGVLDLEIVSPADAVGGRQPELV